MDKRAKELEKLLTQREEKIVFLEAENKLLRQKHNLLIKRVFGASSEKLDPAQLELLLGDKPLGKNETSSESDAAPEEEKPKDKRRPRRRKQPRPENLPVLVTEIIIPDEVKANPDQWVEIGEDKQDLLDVIPATYYKQRTINKKYRSKTDKSRPPLQNPMPPVPILGTHCAPALAANIVVAKYSDHLPHYRQSSILSNRQGINLNRQLLNRWTGATALRLPPTSNSLPV